MGNRFFLWGKKAIIIEPIIVELIADANSLHAGK